jgi:hypothetical protein
MAGMSLQVPAEMEERRRGAEEAYTSIRAALGREGTYDTPEAGAAGAAPTGTTPDLFKAATVSPRAKALAGYQFQQEAYRGVTLDPEAVAGTVMGSPEFRIASRLTAESEQMLKREGPLWEELNSSVVGGIIEGSSAFMNEQSEFLRREYSRGGAARQRARQGMQMMRMQEKVNATKQQQLRDSSLALNQWARDNARTTLEFNQNWAQNLGGIRESFHNALDRAGELMVQSAIPNALGYSQQADVIAAKIHRENKAKAKKIYTMGVSAAAMVVGAAAGTQTGTEIGAGLGISAETMGAVSEGLMGYGATSLLQAGGAIPAETAAGAGGTLGKLLFEAISPGEEGGAETRQPEALRQPGTLEA